MHILDSLRTTFERDLHDHLDYMLANKLSLAPELQNAVRYSLCAGGKRVRALLCLTGCTSCGGNAKDATIVALVIEYLHAYSLIHDDLPAMDNDDLRRGIPTNHKCFGEAMAILAGDALQALSFASLLQLPKQLTHREYILESITDASLAMVSGQSLDIRNKTTHTNLQQMYSLKTGALICASVVSGCLCSNAMQCEQLELVQAIGHTLGSAFQIADDLLEYKQNDVDLGKSATSDKRNAKVTYPSLFGVEKAKQQVKHYHQQARQYIYRLAEKQPTSTVQSIQGLVCMCDYLANRKY